MKRVLRSVVELSVGALLVASLTMPVPTASAARSCEYYEFFKDKNAKSDFYWWYRDEYGRCIRNHQYRAGSGTTEDVCQVNKGWLPNGWYDLADSGPAGHQNNYNGSLIWGRVWHLQDKQCHDGTWRRELFIHTEETPDHDQICTSDDDDDQCWDKTKANPNSSEGTYDYFSAGCVKIRRQSDEDGWSNDMPDVHSDWHDIGGLGHGNGRSDSLWVHS